MALDKQTLLAKMADERQRHREVIENWLDAGVPQPSCGCLVSWKWDWRDGHDWIFPLMANVTGVSGCGNHYRDIENAHELQADYLAMLSERLRQMREETHLPSIP